ncbi:monovalent cation/H+ antiporter complex subunit F [Homoserinimonas sp. OAct 916]|uniref:monovalent cation/H+ antiporter complex subunit F n=1 Tax=Homoserinimonas sp. OAct 916 TaxID=2211450 RepID=UPI000DBE48CF|nr:monovalent cation/H+ antiporter complex subunit F [Homoserinimonas sp. OAct 916]
MMPIVYLVVGVAFTAAALISVYRILVGPRILDRMIASDMLMTTLICVLGVQMVVTGSIITVPIMLALAVTGFLSSIAVARYVSRRRSK